MKIVEYRKITAYQSSITTQFSCVPYCLSYGQETIDSCEDLAVNLSHLSLVVQKL